ncbi:MAG: Arm DNA-binding domain-containing protein [Tabrizicola sp.]
MPLTDAQCRAAKPAAKVQKLSDGRGLFLQVTPGGSKLWRMNYRWRAKQRTAAFGSALLHKSADGRIFPSPGQTHPTT